MSKEHAASINLCIHLTTDKSEEYTTCMSSIESFCKENIDGITQDKINNIIICTREAIYNAKYHAYPEDTIGSIRIMCSSTNIHILTISVIDDGCGIKDLQEAIQPQWSSKKNFAGMGFSIIDSLCDKFEVKTTNPNKGTKVTMTFNI